MNVSQKALDSLSLASHNPTNNSDPSRLRPPPSSSSGMASASAGVAPSTAGRGTSTASATTGNTLDPASPDPDPVPVTALASATATTTSSSSLFSSPDLVPLVMFLQNDRDALQQELKEKDDEIKDLKQKIKKWEEKWAAVRAICLE